MDTFHLLHLLQKNDWNTQDEMSQNSDRTEPKSNKEQFLLCRMQFQLTVTDTSPETFMDGVKLAPWHQIQVEQQDLISELTDNPLMAVKYLYGFKVGMNKAGSQYLRIQIAFPPHYSAA